VRLGEGLVPCARGALMQATALQPTVMARHSRASALLRTLVPVPLLVGVWLSRPASGRHRWGLVVGQGTRGEVCGALTPRAPNSIAAVASMVNGQYLLSTCSTASTARPPRATCWAQPTACSLALHGRRVANQHAAARQRSLGPGCPPLHH
jgi:hypothetical protein